MASTVTAGLLACLLPCGGALGYARKKSVISLVAGCGCGVVYAICVVLMADARRHKQGNGIALAMSLFLMVAMGSRALKTNGTVPVIVSTVAALSAAVFAWNYLVTPTIK